MPRLTATHLLTLASLLVAMALGVVLFAELPAIIRSSRAPTRPATPSPAAATPAPGVPVATQSFRLDAPAGFEVQTLQNGESILYLGDHETTDGLDTVQIAATASSVPGVDIASWQSATLSTVERNGTSVGICVPQTAVVVGGVRGTEIGYSSTARSTSYSDPGVRKPAPGTRICDVYWFGTNKTDNVSYWFRFAATQSGYTGFAPLAEQARASVTWLI